MSIVTLAQVKAQLGYTDEDGFADDAELQAYADAVTGAVEAYKHEIIEVREVTEEVRVRGGPRRSFRVFASPLIELISVVSADDETITWDVSTMRPQPSGVIRIRRGSPWVHGDLLVTVRAGHDPVEDRYVRGALTWLQYAWETQRGAGDDAGAGVEPGEEGRSAPQFFVIPPQVRMWLGERKPVIG